METIKFNTGDSVDYKVLESNNHKKIKIQVGEGNKSKTIIVVVPEGKDEIECIKKSILKDNKNLLKAVREKSVEESSKELKE